MLIQELTRQESLEVLARTHLGRLACARGVQPYIVPIHFAYQNNWLYSFSVHGQKIDWMRANPLVCVEADQMRRELWASCACDPRGRSILTAAALARQRTRWRSAQILWRPGGRM